MTTVLFAVALVVFPCTVVHGRVVFRMTFGVALVGLIVRWFLAILCYDIDIRFLSKSISEIVIWFWLE